MCMKNIAYSVDSLAMIYCLTWKASNKKKITLLEEGDIFWREDKIPKRNKLVLNIKITL
jgi:hypothetical protein